MARIKDYRHLSPIARTLEVIGEKWSLLIVRHLLTGPKRFTDLLVFLNGITPKWLTLRLRDLEAAGIVEREGAERDRREVWYRLTEKGAALEESVAALTLWGIDYALRPPEQGEPSHPSDTIWDWTLFLNARRRLYAHPTTWVLRFDGRGSHTLRFDGECWSDEPGEPGEPPDLVIEVAPEDWVRFLTVPQERLACLDRFRVIADEREREEFYQFMRGRRPTEE